MFKFRVGNLNVRDEGRLNVRCTDIVWCCWCRTCLSVVRRSVSWLKETLDSVRFSVRLI